MTDVTLHSIHILQLKPSFTEFTHRRLCFFIAILVVLSLKFSSPFDTKMHIANFQRINTGPSLYVVLLLTTRPTAFGHCRVGQLPSP